MRENERKKNHKNLHYSHLYRKKHLPCSSHQAEKTKIDEELLIHRMEVKRNGQHCIYMDLISQIYRCPVSSYVGIQSQV